MNMNVPNSLTMLRILLIPVYVGLLNYEQFDYALATLFIAGLTDALDGTIARVADQRTRLGEVLDPLADKLLLTTGFITLSVMHLVPLWITILGGQSRFDVDAGGGRRPFHPYGRSIFHRPCWGRPPR